MLLCCLPLARIKPKITSTFGKFCAAHTVKPVVGPTGYLFQRHKHLSILWCAAQAGREQCHPLLTYCRNWADATLRQMLGTAVIKEHDRKIEWWKVSAVLCAQGYPLDWGGGGECSLQYFPLPSFLLTAISVKMRHSAKGWGRFGTLSQVIRGWLTSPAPPVHMHMLSPHSVQDVLMPLTAG